MNFTQAGLDKIKQELTDLKNHRRVVAERIKTAREFGDLSENSEYEDARNEQSFVEGRIKELQEIVANAKIVAKHNGVDKIELGSVVKIEMNGMTLEYELVGATESNPGAGKISIESPLGFSLIDKVKGQQGELKTPNGKTIYKIIEIK